MTNRTCFRKRRAESQINSLTEQNNILIQDQTELTRLKELYDLDQEYTDYPKVAARIISKDPGNWYDTFMINKGSNSTGSGVDNNVIAGKGLVGIGHRSGDLPGLLSVPSSMTAAMSVLWQSVPPTTALSPEI